MMAARTLLKSWAIPRASRPTASIFCAMAQALFEREALGDIAGDGTDGRDAARVQQELHVLADPDRLAVLRDRGKLEVGVRRAVEDLSPVELASFGLVVRPDQREEMTAEEFLLAVLRDTAGRRIDVGEAPVDIAVINQILRVLDDMAQPLGLGRFHSVCRIP